MKLRNIGKLIAIMFVLALFLIMFLAINGALNSQAKADSTQEVIFTPVYNDQPAIKPEPKKIFVGEFVITAYCPCKICTGKWSKKHPTTADGSDAIQGITIGTDWNTLPEGTKVEIEGLGQRTVEDKPAPSNNKTL